MPAAGYKITIKGQELSFESSVSLDLAKKLVAAATSGDASVNSAPNTAAKVRTTAPATDETPPVDAPSITEYLQSHSAKRIIEQITAIAEYLKAHRGKATFTQEDLISGFEEAGESVPKNLSRDITWAKKAGWIAPKTGSDGEFYVTGSGRAAIAANFGPEVKAKSKASAGGRKKKKKAEPK
jgi:hypothetical protein